MDIDEQLINQNKAGELREEKRGGTLETEETTSTSIREAVQKAKNQTDEKKKTEDSKALVGTPKPNPMLEATNASLKGAWENLLPSWGLTLIWIDIHFLLNKILGPSSFCELGEEWAPDAIKKLGGEKVKQESAMLRILESAGCGCLNLGCLFLIIAAMSLIAMIVSGIENPLKLIQAIFGSLWSYFTGGK